jgi:hypothetical protein
MSSLSLFVAVFFSLTAGESPGSPALDPRLSVHTLVREDIFAGLLDDDADRLATGEKKIEMLLQQRPAEKPALLVWKAGVLLYRAVRALEARQPAEFEEKYRRAIDLLAEAKKLGPNDLGVTAATAGIYSMMADRLPEKYRAAAWSTAYESYQLLWKKQAPFVQQLPTHLRGEMLAGLAQSAQRTGRTKELDEYLGKIQAVLPDTPYARVARQWKDDRNAASRVRMTCLTCHAPGRLAARQAALDRKPESKKD